MRVTKTYRLTAAAFMLLLYTFVATPVQWWHHHSVNTFRNHTGLEQKITAATKSDLCIEENCYVCSHQYSPVDIDAVCPVVTVPDSVNSSEDFLVQPFYSFCPGVLLNKGPPLPKSQ